MALEAVLYQQGLFSGHNNGGNSNSNNKDLYSLLDSCSWSFPLTREEVELGDNGSSSCYPYFLDPVQPENPFYENDNGGDRSGGGEWDFSTTPLVIPSFNDNDWVTPPNSSSENDYTPKVPLEVVDPVPQWDLSPPTTVATSASPAATFSARPKRRRARSKKNREDIENQRMTHIAVERNRRKQMNEYLAVLKSLMPDAYVQRGDQASIVGGAINFVKELEQNLQSLSAQKKKPTTMSHNNHHIHQENSLPFGELFSFPQYSISPFMVRAEDDLVADAEEETKGGDQRGQNNQISTLGDVEVTMVESHANLKIRSRQRPKQLLKMVTGLQSLRLTILHLNVSTVDHIAFYSMSVKVEDDSKLTSVDEIATAVHQLLGRIEEEAQ